ncbi:MAG: hypothetical protein HY078_11405 [Elusimicrobia bacterium]|nr:hypothetical protein [Elusimicrobiota bacterium]
MKRFALIAVLTSLGLAESAAAQITRPEYSSLAGCPVISHGPDWHYVDCGGVRGYKILVAHSWGRPGLELKTPDGGKLGSLNFDFFGPLSSRLSWDIGDRAEWRIRGDESAAAPVALIVRVTLRYYPENGRGRPSYLTVSKIGPDGTCVTDSIPPGPQQEMLAAQAAETAPSRNCLAAGK